MTGAGALGMICEGGRDVEHWHALDSFCSGGGGAATCRAEIGGAEVAEGAVLDLAGSWEHSSYLGSQAEAVGVATELQERLWRGGLPWHPLLRR